MIRFIRIVLIIFSVSYSMHCLSNEYAISYDQSMGFETVQDYQACIKQTTLFFEKVLQEYNAQYFFEVTRHLYERNNLSIIKPSQCTKIPKIIHQIWLGSQFPEQYREWQQSWINYNPGWEYKLWTDDNINELVLTNKKYFDEAINFGEKSNILRYEILYQFGGVYVDCDFECLKSFDPLVHAYDFFCGLISGKGRIININNAVIGSIPGHPILKKCIENIPLKKQHELYFRTGSLAQYNIATGPYLLTDSFCAVAPLVHDTVIALPGSFLYPLHNAERKSSEQTKRAIVKQRPEAFAVHYWAHQNLKPIKED